MIVRSKNFSLVVPYTYTLTRLEDGVHYHGVRWGNVRRGVSPVDDLGKMYFSSGIFKMEYKNDPSKFSVRLRWTFSSVEDAVNWETCINRKIIHRRNWINISAGKSNVDLEKMCARRSESLMRTYGVRHNFLIPEVDRALKENMVKKYGCENPGQSSVIRQRVRLTTMKKFGVECTFQSESVKSKIRNSLVEKFGVDNPRKSKKIQSEMKQRCLADFGVEHTFQRVDVIQKIGDKRRQMCIRLSKMSEPEFEAYLSVISHHKAVQNQKRTQRRMGLKIMNGELYG